jgi:ATP-dependent DNA helicase RecG
LLFPSNTTANLTRLKHLETTHSGIKLAQIDMEIRGPGNMFGTKQSGYIDLKIASLTDLATITLTHQAASKLLSEDPTLLQYPELLAQIRSLLDKVSTTD